MRDGRIDAAPCITGRIDLGDIVERGFHELIESKDRHASISFG